MLPGKNWKSLIFSSVTFTPSHRLTTTVQMSGANAPRAMTLAHKKSPSQGKEGPRRMTDILWRFLRQLNHPQYEGLKLCAARLP